MFKNILGIFTVFIIFPVVSFLIGLLLRRKMCDLNIKYKPKLNSKGLISLFSIAFCFICLYRTINIGVWLAVLALPLMGVGFSIDKPVMPQKGYMKINKSHLLWLGSLTAVFLMTLLSLKPIYNIDWSDRSMLENNRISILYLLVLSWISVYLLVTFINNNNKINAIILFTVLYIFFLVLIMKVLWRNTYPAGMIKVELTTLFSDQVILLNVGILIIISTVFYFALGKIWGTVFNVFLYSFLFLSNFIKLRYHNTFFNWFDLLQIKEMILISRDFLTIPILVTVVLCVAVGMILLTFLIRILKTKIRIALKPHIWIIPTIALLLLLGNIYYRISEDQYSNLNIYKRTWENESVNVRLNGLIINLVLNYNLLDEVIMDEPEEYGQEAADKLLAQLQIYSENSEITDVNPDVILIMAESLFDLDGVEGLTFDVDIDATIDAYSTSSILSPRYGGYTSAMEFEVLTGLTLAFMPPSLTPFTTYFNNPDDNFPSIVQEFKKSGYSSVVVHPNLPDYYNRTIVYKNMGFDEYQSITSFATTEENTTLNGWITDIELGNHIINELKKTVQPQFVYAVTLEGHYVNVEKYSEPQIHVISDQLNEGVLSTISQQATSYYHTDQMIQNIIDYMDSSDRPTLLYVFGDHLPPLAELSDLGYLNNLENKYKTSLLMYSNYKDISAEVEYITPNQLAAQIVTDAEIEHNSYFDYLFGLRDKYPVIHQEFTDIVDNEELDVYRFIQYDILFGERYLVN